MLVGGCEALVNRFGIAAFGAMQAYLQKEDPSQASRPFDQGRQGFVMAEGAAALVLNHSAKPKVVGPPFTASYEAKGSVLMRTTSLLLTPMGFKLNEP